MSDHDERNHHGQEPATRETPLWSAPPPGPVPAGPPPPGPVPAGPAPAGGPPAGPPPTGGMPPAGPPPTGGMPPAGPPPGPPTEPMAGPRHLDPYATGPQPVVGPPPTGAQPPISGAPATAWSGQAQIPPVPPYPPGGGYGPEGGYGQGGGYGPPTYAGQPTWGPPGPASSPAGGAARPGQRVLSVALVLALTTLAAVGGGVVGAWLYGRGDSNGAGDAAGVTVVDAPQLDYTSLASVASEVTPSVVQIRAGDGSGSGVVMSDGYVLTNAHVVATASNDEVSVRFSNGETAPATIVGADARSDIAVVRVDGDADLTPARFGDSDQALVGDTVLAIGSPLGFDGSVTQGIISQRDRTLPVGGGSEPRRSLSGLLQTDASINPGNSGGPLVNLDGEVIGINTAIATDGQANGFLGLGFAVPSNRATDVAQQLIDGEEVSHAFLGVSVTTVESGGALIGEIAPGSPAEQAGLREGDIVNRVNGQAIADSSDLVNMVQSAAPGDTLEIEFERDGVGQTTSVTLVEVAD